jgi:hypothetical protein
MLGAVKCVAHPDANAAERCAACDKALCSACIAFDVDGKASCEACGVAAEERARALGTGLLALVGVGYLATLAIGVALFHARPFIGGIAALVAIGLGRVLQLVIPLPLAVRHLGRS